MSALFWLKDEQMTKLAPFFPKSHGKPQVDDKRVLSGIGRHSHVLVMNPDPRHRGERISVTGGDHSRQTAKSSAESITTLRNQVKTAKPKR